MLLKLFLTVTCDSFKIKSRPKQVNCTSINIALLKEWQISRKKSQIIK